MPELQAGHVLGLTSIKTGGLTYQGKPLQFECVDEENRVYVARAELTKEEIAAGNNVEQEFTIQFPVGEGVVSVVPKVPKLLEDVNKNLKDMTDAEKHTYINSLEYSVGRKEEPRQLADGSQATPTGIKAAASKPAQQEAKKQEANDKKAEEALGSLTTAKENENKGGGTSGGGSSSSTSTSGGNSSSNSSTKK